jgi:hypothetical protein
MLTVTVVYGGRGAYYIAGEGLLLNPGYYSSGELEKQQSVGWFRGEGAQTLGLEGEPILHQDKRVDQLFKAEHPSTGDKLRQTPRRFYTDPKTGQRKEYLPVAAIDLTFSAAKEFSIFWATAPKPIRDRSRLVHTLAILDTIQQIQADGCICARVGAGGSGGLLPSQSKNT